MKEGGGNKTTNHTRRLRLRQSYEIGRSGFIELKTALRAYTKQRSVLPREKNKLMKAKYYSAFICGKQMGS